MQFAKYLLFVLMLITLAGCQHDPYAGDYTTDRPKFTEVLGRYTFEQQTVWDSTLESFKKATITLNADGNYNAVNIPNLVNDSTFKGRESVSTTGKWDIESIGDIDNGFGHPKPDWGVVLTHIPQTLTNIGFMGDSPPYKLIIEYDDLDLGEVMIFSKKK